MMEEGSSGSGAGLCAIGTQARAPPVCLMSMIGSKYYSTVVLQVLAIAEEAGLCDNRKIKL